MRSSCCLSLGLSVCLSLLIFRMIMRSPCCVYPLILASVYYEITLLSVSPLIIANFFIFHEVCIVSKDSWRLVLPRIFV
jgi:hypothetical protein